jgi:hypothetical protein
VSWSAGIEIHQADDCDPGGVQPKNVGCRMRRSRSTRAAKPWAVESCASTMAAASSMRLRPATQSTGCCPSLPVVRITANAVITTLMTARPRDTRRR